MLDDYSESESSTKDPKTYAITKMKDVAPNVELLSRRVEGQRIYAKLLKRAGFNPDKNVKYLKHFDNSENQPVGLVSRKIYNNLANDMLYNGYCQRVNPVKDDDDDDFLSKMNSNNSIVSLGTSSGDSAGVVSLLTKRGKMHDRRTGILTLEDGTPAQMPSLQTPLWRIGYKPKYNPPPGFSASPAASLNSHGNHVFFSYDGDWHEGFMHGIGKYMYSDGLTYSGGYNNNIREGIGRSDLPNMTVYQGEWKNDKYEGKGILQMGNGLGEYEGYFVNGLFHGMGEIRLRSGLVYQGEFREGAMWDKVTITSNSSGYKYEGHIQNSSIYGSGVMTFPKLGRRIQRFWPQLMSGKVKMSLRKAVDSWRQSEQLQSIEKKKLIDSSVGYLLKSKLVEYVKRCKDSVKSARLQRKKEDKERRKKAILEERARQKEARLKMLEAAYGAEAAAVAAKQDVDSMSFSSDSLSTSEKKTDDSGTGAKDESTIATKPEDVAKRVVEDGDEMLERIEEDDDDDDGTLESEVPEKSRVEEYEIGSTQINANLIDDALTMQKKKIMMSEKEAEDIIFRVSDKEKELLQKLAARRLKRMQVTIEAK